MYIHLDGLQTPFIQVICAAHTPEWIIDQRHTTIDRIVIVNSRFLEHPQKRSRRNQLIHRHLTKTKSIGSSQDPKSQAGRQSDGYGGWCLELRRGVRHVDDDESG